MYVIKHIGIDSESIRAAAGVDVMSGDKDEMRRESRPGQPLHNHANGLKNREQRLRRARAREMEKKDKPV